MIRLILGLGNPGEEYRATRHNVGFRVVEELARRWQVRLDTLECNALTARVDGMAVPVPAAPVRAAADSPAGADAAAPALAAAATVPAPPPVPAVLSALPAGAVPAMPALPATPAMPAVPAVPAMPEVPATPAVPALPGNTAAAPGAAEAPAATGAVILAAPQTYMNRSGYAARCLVERHAIAPARVLVVYDEVNLPLGRLRLRRGGSPAGHRGIESILENLRTDQVARLRVGIAPPAGAVAAEGLADFVLTPFAAAEDEELEPVLGRAADACETWLREGIDAAMNRFNGG